MAGDFCFLFLFSNNRQFFKGSADDLSPLTLSYSHKRTNACVKNLRHGFLVERIKKQMRCLGTVKLSENVWFVGVYKENESATAIRVRTVLKGG